MCNIIFVGNLIVSMHEWKKMQICGIVSRIKTLNKIDHGIRKGLVP